MRWETQSASRAETLNRNVLGSAIFINFKSRTKTQDMVEKYFTQREREEQSTYEALLTHAKTQLPKELFSFLSSMSFVMFKPDAYLRGVIPSILKLFVKNEIYPVKYKLKQLEAADIDKLYMFVKPKYIESWWIME